MERGREVNYLSPKGSCVGFLQNKLIPITQVAYYCVPFKFPRKLHQ